MHSQLIHKSKGYAQKKELKKSSAVPHSKVSGPNISNKNLCAESDHWPLESEISLPNETNGNVLAVGHFSLILINNRYINDLSRDAYLI